jgi:hypothetical protein
MSKTADYQYNFLVTLQDKFFDDDFVGVNEQGEQENLRSFFARDDIYDQTKQQKLFNSFNKTKQITWSYTIKKVIFTINATDLLITCNKSINFEESIYHWINAEQKAYIKRHQERRFSIWQGYFNKTLESLENNSAMLDLLISITALSECDVTTQLVSNEEKIEQIKHFSTSPSFVESYNDYYALWSKQLTYKSLTLRHLDKFGNQNQSLEEAKINIFKTLTELKEGLRRLHISTIDSTYF